jgi:class 3 adenylate cyclase
MQRQLAAILFADVVGYSRLMDHFEVETHVRLMSIFNAIIEPAVGSDAGQIVKNTGDGFLARFTSVNAAFKAAVSIQEMVAQREREQSTETCISFRMGLHTGDIFVVAHDVYGAGVNIAARL